MPSPDMSHPSLFLEYTPLDTPASVAEAKLAALIPKTPGTLGPVDLAFKDPLEGSSW